MGKKGAVAGRDPWRASRPGLQLAAVLTGPPQRCHSRSKVLSEVRIAEVV